MLYIIYTLIAIYVLYVSTYIGAIKFYALKEPSEERISSVVLYTSTFFALGVFHIIASRYPIGIALLVGVLSYPILGKRLRTGLQSLEVQRGTRKQLISSIIISVAVVVITVYISRFIP